MGTAFIDDRREPTCGLTGGIARADDRWEHEVIYNRWALVLRWPTGGSELELLGRWEQSRS